MSKPVLADSGPLYALADPSDQYHQRALKELGRLESGNCYLVVPYPTVAESYTLVMRRLGGRFARSWLRELLEGVTALNPEPADYAVAAKWVGDFADQEISLFDAVAAVLSRRLNLPVWTFDRHFALLRVERWT